MSIQNLHTTPEPALVIDIGDIVAAIALVVSIIIFIVGQLLVKRSEKRRLKREEALLEAEEKFEGRRTAREQMDRILRRQQGLDEYLIKSRGTEGTYSLKDELQYIDRVISECEYLGYLIHENDIKDKKTIDYYKPRIRDVLKDLNEKGNTTIKSMRSYQEQHPEADYKLLIDRHSKLIDNISLYWEGLKLTAE